MTINIRRFKKQDIDDAKRLMIQLCELTGTVFLEERFLWGLKMRLYDALKKNGMLVAEEDLNGGEKKIIGFLLADINIEPTGTSTGYIRTVIIDANARGKGVGKELVNHAINYLKTMDVDSILVNVRASTTTARKLYENLGFRELYRVMEFPVSKKKKENLKLPNNYMNFEDSGLQM
ncbi:MAG: GNAT family N-acetyltransferase [Candidatus Helarchaeota archaeon]